MILFVRVNSKDITKFLGRKDNQFYGFISIDRLGRIPAKIPDKDINTLKYMLGATDKSVIFEQQVIGVGDSVKIVRGVFKGLIGNIQTMKDGTVYLVVDMDKLGFVKAEINLSDCSKIEEDGRFKKAVASL
jgi:transcription antitermination factor NusG